MGDTPTMPDVQLPSVSGDGDKALYLMMGQLVLAVNTSAQASRANALATAENTKALQDGKIEFKAIHSDISEIKGKAPCLSVQPLPSVCPVLPATQTASVPVPPPPADPNAEMEAEIATVIKGGQTLAGWAKSNWHWITGLGGAATIGHYADKIISAFSSTPTH